MTRRQEIYARTIKEEFVHTDRMDDEIIYLLPQKLAEEFGAFLKSKEIFAQITHPGMLGSINLVDLSIIPEPKEINMLIDQFVAQMAERA